MRKALFASLLELLSIQIDASSIKVPRQAPDATAIQFGSCGSSAPSRLECAQFPVPIDWSNPNGPKINLGVSRVRASSNATRLGSVFYNPGGPGGSATSGCLAFAAGSPIFTDTLHAHFDIICPDPRGVGTSNAIQCSPDLWNVRQTLFPSDNATYQQMVDMYRAIGESCLNMTGDLVRYVDTVSVARDFEALRIALNESKLNYLGVSYGSQIGTTYAELYPQNVGAMALDGILDHTASPTYFHVTRSETYEHVLGSFFDWCANTTTCALHGQNVSQIFDSLVKQADQTPIAAPDCLPTSNSTRKGLCFSDVTGEDIRFNAAGFLTAENGTRFNSRAGGSTWFSLGQALGDAQQGNASLLSTPLATSNDSPLFARLAIECLDWRANRNFADNKYKQMLTASTSPYTKGATQSYMIETQCAGWPIAATNPQKPLNETAMSLTSPLLLVNSYYDPACSYTWANNIKEQVPNGVLLTRNGYGHTSYFLSGEATTAIDAYLVNGTVPAPGAIVQT